MLGQGSIHSRQRGKINFGCIVGGLVLLIAVYGAIKFLPVKIAISEIRDTAENEATMGSIKKDGDIRYEIMRKIKDLQKEHPGKIKFEDEDITIMRSSDQISVQFEIMVPIELIGGNVYEYREKFEVKRTLF